MTSIKAAGGRTWFNYSPPTAQPATHYLGIHVPLTLMRNNACTFNDFNTSYESMSRKKLLRMFLRINHRLMEDRKMGEGARAYIEWDSEDAISLPTYFRIHVIYRPEDPAFDCLGKGVSALEECAKYDKSQLAKEGVERNDLILRADMWSALASTYTGCMSDYTSDDFSLCPPEVVFDTSWTGDRYSQGVFEPKEQMVEMARMDLCAELFFLKYCPWYQQRQLPDTPLQCNTEQAPQLLNLSRTVPEELPDEMLSVWELLKIRAARAKSKSNYCEWARAEITHCLKGPQAGYVPKPEKCLNEFDTPVIPVSPYADPSLSPFGTWVARFLMECEAFTFMYKQHLLLLKLLLGSFDVAREAGNGQIHYSGILAGPNSTSKSYVFTLIEDLLIPGTVDRATRRTENSFTYNRDQGCRVLIDHEMSADFFGEVHKDGGMRTAQTKEILTSHEATTEACQYVDGQRVMVESRSRAHLCYLAATNDWSVGQTSKGESTHDSALVSRFDVIFPTRGGAVENKSIMALMAADRDPSRVEVEGKHALAQWVRALQQTNYWIHRLIYLEGMQAVNLDAVHAVVDQYSVHRSVPPRTVERIIIIARQCCIITAIMQHYGFEGSPRAGEAPCPNHIHELEPHLVVTAEQAKFALGLFEADLCSNIAQPFSEALRALSFRPDPDLGFNYVRVQGCETATQLTDEILMHIPCGNDVSRDLLAAHMASLREQTIVSHPYVPRVGTAHGVAPDETANPQRFYRMRSLSFHMSMIDSPPEAVQPLEEIISRHCHVGPARREITTSLVPGHAHLLQTRDITAPMAPYKQAGMFMPAESACLLRHEALEALQQEHRSCTQKVVEAPVECAELERRGATPFVPAPPASECSYPDMFANAYLQQQNKRRKVDQVHKIT